MGFTPLSIAGWGLMGAKLGAGAMVADQIVLSLEEDGLLDVALAADGIEVTLSETEGGWFGLPGQFG